MRILTDEELLASGYPNMDRDRRKEKIGLWSLNIMERVAKAQAGQLKLICLDGWNKINPSARTWIEKEINEDEFQYVVVSTEDGDLTMNVSEGTVKEDV